MPLIQPGASDPAIDGRQSETALEIRKGVTTGLLSMEKVFLPEFTLPGGRRADLIGLGPNGEIIIVEIKSSIADFASDSKWHEYLPFCDHFYFASHPIVPMETFPEEEGFILADKRGCEIIRPAQTRKLNAARRKSITLKLARAASRRLMGFLE